MASAFFLLVLSAILGVKASPLPEVPAKCQRYTFCNGQMCDEICEIGTVELDPWVSGALAFQRNLQFNRSLFLAELPGAHNGGMAQDYGTGIEEKFLKELLLPIYGERLSEVVIANQRHSIYDQLRMGIRQMEVDVYYFRRLGGFKICHWPIPPPDFVVIVNNAAERQGMAPLDWDPGNLGCDDKKPFLVEKFQEIRRWLDEPDNRNEIMDLYIDNKNVNANLIPDFVNLTLAIFGDILFTPEQKQTEYPDRWPTIAELVAKNRRVFLENRRDSWLGDGLAARYIFTPSIWSVQFGPNNFQKYPLCTVDNQDFRGREMTRSLDGSLTLGPAFLWEGRTDYPVNTIYEMSQCSINMQAMDQVTPITMQYFVWSWDQNQPNPNYPCTALNGQNSRWSTLDCNSVLPAACVNQSNDFDWVLTAGLAWNNAGNACPSGYIFGLPWTGIVNSKLNQVANGQSVWVNYRS